MCEIDKSSTQTKNGGIDLSMTCKQSGKPISVSNHYGMFCADMCDLQANKDAEKKLKSMFPGVF